MTEELTYDLEAEFEALHRKREKCEHVYEPDEDLGNGVYSARCIHCGKVPNFDIIDN